MRLRRRSSRRRATEEPRYARDMEGFEGAFADAFHALPAEDRLALRMHFAEGLNLDGWRPRSASRARPRGAGCSPRASGSEDETMRLVGERLDASRTEVESVLRVMRSGLDVSFGALVSSA